MHILRVELIYRQRDGFFIGRVEDYNPTDKDWFPIYLSPGYDFPELCIEDVANYLHKEYPNRSYEVDDEILFLPMSQHNPKVKGQGPTLKKPASRFQQDYNPKICKYTPGE